MHPRRGHALHWHMPEPAPISDRATLAAATASDALASFLTDVYHALEGEEWTTFSADTAAAQNPAEIDVLAALAALLARIADHSAQKLDDLLCQDWSPTPHSPKRPEIDQRTRSSWWSLWGERLPLFRYGTAVRK